MSWRVRARRRESARKWGAWMIVHLGSCGPETSRSLRAALSLSRTAADPIEVGIVDAMYDATSDARAAVACCRVRGGRRGRVPRWGAKRFHTSRTSARLNFDRLVLCSSRPDGTFGTTHRVSWGWSRRPMRRRRRRCPPSAHGVRLQNPRTRSGRQAAAAAAAAAPLGPAQALPAAANPELRLAAAAAPSQRQQLVASRGSQRRQRRPRRVQQQRRASMELPTMAC